MPRGHLVAICDGHGNKRCGSCRFWLALENFHRCPHGKGGRHSYCHDCQRAHSLASYHRVKAVRLLGARP